MPSVEAHEVIRSSVYCSMVHLTHQLTDEITPALHEAGVTPALYFLLGHLVGDPGASPAELARRTAFSPQHVAQLLERAEQRGLVDRSGPRGRGHRTVVTLTDAGSALLHAAWPAVHGAGDDRLSSAQQAQLLHLFDRLRHIVDTEDVVVLVDDEGSDAGTRPRALVHTQDTPLHRAFSLYLRDDDGRVLLTRRALHKATWPGVWSNAACGHLRPGEQAIEAVMRRVPQELGAPVTGVRCALPDFRYRAVDASGVVENEVCPVFTGRVRAAALDPDPAEVAEVAWVEWSDLRRTAATMPGLLSPWSTQQIEQLGSSPW